MPGITVKIDAKKCLSALGAISAKQIPFATAVALNDLAFQVQRAAASNLQATFKNPRPFTLRSVQVVKATKSTPFATVSIRPEVSKYLQPYETGGVHVLPSKALLDPKNIRLDQYGQLPRTALQRLSANRNVFVGNVRGVRGFWQRTKGHGLKLLIRFGDALPVTKHLGFEARGIAVVKAQFETAFYNAMGRALNSSK